MTTLVDVGPYGLSDICYFGHHTGKLPVEGKLQVYSTVSSTHHSRLVIVQNAHYSKYADAWFDGSTREELALAEQWLLDMCVVMYGGDT